MRLCIYKMADGTRSSAVALNAMKTLLFSSVYLDRSSPARGTLPSSRNLDESETQRRRRRGRYVRFRRALTCGLVAALVESHSTGGRSHKNCQSRSLRRRRRRRRRRIKHHQRVDIEFWDTVTASWDESTWIANFRISRRTFRFLCADIKHKIEGVDRHRRRRPTCLRDTSVRRRPPVAKCVALALWRLATNIDYDTLSWLFGVSKSTARDIVRRVCKAIGTLLMPRFVNVPCGDALQEITRGFQEINGLPNVCGVIGIGYIPIVTGMSSKMAGVDILSDDQSMAVQAVVDYRGLFMDCSIGWPGRMHPADILNNSPLYEKGEDGHLFNGLPNVETTDGYNIPGYFVGDSVHPLLDWIMKPFVVKTDQVVQQQKNQDHIKQLGFNTRVSEVRNVFQEAFGRLRGRWRCLSKRLDVESTSDAPLVIATCVTLHNLCEIQGEVFRSDWLSLANHPTPTVDGRPTLPTDVVHSDDCRDERSSYVTLQGEELRSVLCDYPR